MATSDFQSEADVTASGSVIRGQIAVQMDPGASCGVVDSARDAEIVRHRIKVHHTDGHGSSVEASDTLYESGECHAELLHADGKEDAYGRKHSEYVVCDTEPGCICPVLEANDCLAEIEEIHGRTVFVSVTVPDRETFRELIADLQEVASSVSVERLIMGREDNPTVELRIDELTPKQREAVETALDAGYYERPRETDLEDLASKLGISRSAVSQRLNTVEGKLVKSLQRD